MIGAKGSVKRTDKGELSVYVKSWAMLSKSVLPLPDKFHGLKDTEKRYRQVYMYVHTSIHGAPNSPPCVSTSKHEVNNRSIRWGGSGESCLARKEGTKEGRLERARSLS